MTGPRRGQTSFGEAEGLLGGQFSLIYAALFKPGPLGTLLGPTLVENRPKKREKLKYLILPIGPYPIKTATEHPLPGITPDRSAS